MLAPSKALGCRSRALQSGAGGRRCPAPSTEGEGGSGTPAESWLWLAATHTLRPREDRWLDKSTERKGILMDKRQMIKWP